MRFLAVAGVAIKMQAPFGKKVALDRDVYLAFASTFEAAWASGMRRNTVWCRKS